LKMAVDASGVVNDRTGANGSFELASDDALLFLATQRSQLNFTSPESAMRPLVGARLSHLRPLRTLKVTVRPSGETSQLSARSGSTEPSGSLSDVPVLYCTRRL